ncbi:hypothetical protein TNCV_4589521 [Trichonephila clavipes]|nr:hypothetical protein TNCV_4589521 [Trichonephila clavipes]
MLPLHTPPPVSWWDRRTKDIVVMWSELLEELLPLRELGHTLKNTVKYAPICRTKIEKYRFFKVHDVLVFLIGGAASSESDEFVLPSESGDFSLRRGLLLREDGITTDQKVILSEFIQGLIR